MYMSHLSPADMVFYKEVDEITKEGKIMSGGFSIESLLWNKGESPMYTANSPANLTGGNSVSGIFKNLAVPAGLLYQKNYEKKRKLFEYTEGHQELVGGFKDSTVFPEDIHSLLMKMVEVNESGKTSHERKTRKHRVSKEKNKEKKNLSRKA
jgi:hypothetical protein